MAGIHEAWGRFAYEEGFFSGCLNQYAEELEISPNDKGFYAKMGRETGLSPNRISDVYHHKEVLDRIKIHMDVGVIITPTLINNTDGLAPAAHL